MAHAFFVPDPFDEALPERQEEDFRRNLHLQAAHVFGTYDETLAQEAAADVRDRLAYLARSGRRVVIRIDGARPGREDRSLEKDARSPQGDAMTPSETPTVEAWQHNGSCRRMSIERCLPPYPDPAEADHVFSELRVLSQYTVSPRERPCGMPQLRAAMQDAMEAGGLAACGCVTRRTGRSCT